MLAVAFIKNQDTTEPTNPTTLQCPYNSRKTFAEAFAESQSCDQALYIVGNEEKEASRLCLVSLFLKENLFLAPASAQSHWYKHDLPINHFKSLLDVKDFATTQSTSTPAQPQPLSSLQHSWAWREPPIKLSSPSCRGQPHPSGFLKARGLWNVFGQNFSYLSHWQQG